MTDKTTVTSPTVWLEQRTKFLRGELLQPYIEIIEEKLKQNLFRDKFVQVRVSCPSLEVARALVSAYSAWNAESILCDETGLIVYINDPSKLQRLQGDYGQPIVDDDGDVVYGRIIPGDKVGGF